MSAETVAVVSRMLDAWQRRDFEATLAHFSEDVVWLGVGPETAPSRGREGVDRAMAEWVGAFSDYWVKACDLIDAGDDVVLIWREGGRGRTSGVEVEDEGATVFTVKDGLITRARFYLDREEALAATSDAGPGPRP
jgi:ketosteroid isomerase-like protein